MLGFASLSEAPFATLSGDAIRLESSASLDSSFLLSPDLSAIYFSQQTFNIDSNLLLDSINRSYISSELLSEFQLTLDSFIAISSDANLNVESQVLSQSLIQIINQITIDSNTSIQSDSFIRSLISTDLNIEFSVDANPANISFNSVNFEIIATLQSNFSQVNRDIVYYVLYREKNKPFTLNIARVK